jgi:hypothetical protein
MLRVMLYPNFSVHLPLRKYSSAVVFLTGLDTYFCSCACVFRKLLKTRAFLLQSAQTLLNLLSIYFREWIDEESQQWIFAYGLVGCPISLAV